MAVRNDLQMADGRRATLLWFLEQVAVPNKPRGCLPCEFAEEIASPLVTVGVYLSSCHGCICLMSGLLSAPGAPSCAANCAISRRCS